MGTVASSWSAGKLTPEQIRKIEHRNVAKLPATPKPSLVACHECKDGVLRPHGGHGLCTRHYAAWRRATSKGDCTRCDARGVSLGLVDPPVCVACYRRERRARMTEGEREIKRRGDREHHRERRKLNPGESTRYEHGVRARDPEKYERMLARRRERYAAMLREETPEGRAERLAKLKTYRQDRGQALKQEGEKYRSHLDRPVPPQKTRVVGLSGYLHDTEPEVTIRKIPEQAGIFDDAIASRRAEVRPDKKYRRRPRAA